jgi:hypothetical protein
VLVGSRTDCRLYVEDGQVMVVVEVLRSSSDVVSSMGDMFFISLFDPMSCTYRRLGVLTVLPILALSFFPFIPPPPSSLIFHLHGVALYSPRQLKGC